MERTAVVPFAAAAQALCGFGPGDSGGGRRPCGRSSAWRCSPGAHMRRASQASAVTESYGPESDIVQITACDADSDSPPSADPRVRGAPTAMPRMSVLMASACEESTRGHLLAGTALVFADMAVKNTMRPAALAAEVAKSARFFRGVRDGAGHSFGELYYLFTGMLFPANLPQDSLWMPRSRLWRFVLLQQPEGYWDLTRVSASAATALTCVLALS